MQAILLAAGFGTRLKPYTLIKPKPLFPVLNRPLLHILLDKLFTYGCTSIVVNSHHLADQIQHAVQGYVNVQVQYEPEILGTGGALRNALKSLKDEPILVMNGDIYHDIDIGELYRRHRDSSCGVTMAMHDFPRFNSVGVENGYVIGFKKNENHRCRAFTGVHVVDPEVVAMIPKTGFYHIIDLYEILAGRHQIGEYDCTDCLWSDIGTPEDYLALNGYLLRNEKRDIKDKKNPAWLIHETAEVGEGVVFEEWGVVGPGAVICSGAKLRASVIWEKAVVEVQQSVIDTIYTGKPIGVGK